MDQQFHFGLKISELLKARNITKVKAAEMMGYSRKGFSDAIEKEDVSTSLLKKVCEVFNVDMTYFFPESASIISQKGKANIAGSGNVQYKGEGNSMNSDSGKLEILKNENQHLKKQIALLEQMVEVLRSKT